MLNRDSAAFSHCFTYINAVTGRHFALRFLEQLQYCKSMTTTTATTFLLPSPIWMEGPSPPSVESPHPLPMGCMRGDSPAATGNGQVTWNRDGGSDRSHTRPG